MFNMTTKQEWSNDRTKLKKDNSLTNKFYLIDTTLQLILEGKANTNDNIPIVRHEAHCTWL